MHDDSEMTTQALAVLLPEWRAAGFECARCRKRRTRERGSAAVAGCIARTFRSTNESRARARA